jgi:hypothetical protein
MLNGTPTTPKTIAATTIAIVDADPFSACNTTRVRRCLISL